jgi:hypothetical protein
VSHLEPDRLVLLALGEADQDPSAHLASCELCRAEVADLRTVAGLGRESQDLTQLPAPPERVWAGITEGLGLPVPMEKPPKRPTWALTVVAAALAAVVGIVVTFSLVRAPHTSPSACGPRTTLTPLPAAPQGVRAEACLVTSDGERKLRVTASGMPAPQNGFYEVWLIDRTSLGDPAHLRMATLGNMSRQASEDFTVPPNVDVARYDVVDISAEPNDGNAAHSGDSLLRGTL